ncbi:MAG: ParB family protein [Rhodocyclaceae bacterium]
MADLTPQDMASKLLAEGFARTGPVATALTDPVADTPMVVTLDQLRPYDHNPRVTRNPLYDEIKASIRERGLDAPPAITRRPGESAYIIRNGGNTRLAILRELWGETKDERFFRLPCLFRPWPARGEIVALTGHLAENELHGSLSFIERALGVEKARELYEQEGGQALSQSELARRLTADGFPIQQSHISRMRDAVQYLLPAIPNVLYGGLGRHQVERLSVLRRACERIWAQRAHDQRTGEDFQALFHEVVATFDSASEAFSVQRVQDELVGQMAEQLDVDYDTLNLEVGDNESRQRALGSEPTPASAHLRRTGSTTSPARPPSEAAGTLPTHASPPSPMATTTSSSTEEAAAPAQDAHASPSTSVDRLQGHIVSPAPTTERLQSIQRMVADQSGDALPDFEANVLRAIPVQAGGLYPISDVWYIEPGLDSPVRLRVHIAQFAREIAEEAGQADCIEPTDDGLGFVCNADALSANAHSLPFLARAVLTLLQTLSIGYLAAPVPLTTLDDLRLTDALGPLLQGRRDRFASDRLSDNGLVKLFRLLRLARRLLDLEAGAKSSTAT